MGLLKKIFAMRESRTDVIVPSPPSSEAIAKAEAALTLKFPASYLSFLREPPPMRLPLGARFYSVGEERLGADNIVEANRREHEEAFAPLPRFLEAFYNDGMGNQVCFDTRRVQDGEYPIVFWDHELEADENLAAAERASGHPERAGVIAWSFAQWLKILREMADSQPVSE